MLFGTRRNFANTVKASVVNDSIPGAKNRALSSSSALCAARMVNHLPEEQQTKMPTLRSPQSRHLNERTRSTTALSPVSIDWRLLAVGWPLRRTAAAVAVAIPLCFCTPQAEAATYSVENTADAGPGSLRAAIIQANANPNSTEPDTIQFNLPGSGVRTITVASALPDIDEGVRLNGWSQPGFAGSPLVELKPASGLVIDGLHITEGSTVVRGLVINGFRNGIVLSNLGGNTIQGCYIGSDSTGTQPVPNERGILSNATSGNLIGGTFAAARNLISGNRLQGAFFLETNELSIQSSRNTFQGNYVGTDVTGTQPIPNCPTGGCAGLRIVSNDAVIGGAEPGAGNLVSGNGGDGISITGFRAVVAGNKIGTVLSGSRALANRENGLSFASLDGTIGGPEAGARNLISGNGGTGVVIRSSNGTIQGNFVGSDGTGQFAIPNMRGGLDMEGRDNLIGGITSQLGNLISGNQGAGIVMNVATGFRGTRIPPSAIVQGNVIGSNADGTAALPNAGPGIQLNGSSGTVIGGRLAAARNLISGNLGNGIEFGEVNSSDSIIQGNLIGTARDGRAAQGNQKDGIFFPKGLFRAHIIGASAGPHTDEGNIIKFNQRNGITFTSAEEGPYRISANSISDNGKLGIDLGDDGVTPNDPDISPSPSPSPATPYRQNFPVITATFAFEGKLILYGTLSSVNSTEFTLEFFANEVPDSSGFGEGQILLGQAKIKTDASGEAAFNVTFPLPVDVSSVTATAIKPNGDTSEFSAAAQIVASQPSTPPTAPTAVVLATRVNPDQLLNISTRAQVMTGDRVLIAGFIVSGSESKNIIVRGIGPSLAQSGVPAPLGDPILELYDSSGRLLVANDNWKESQRAEIEGTGIPPRHDLEAAIVRTLPPGSYTAVLQGRSESALGVGLVEVFDLNQSADGYLVNLSTRGFVGSGDNVMIGGFIVGGSGGGSATVLLRAIGPSLASSGVQGALADPLLEVRNANGFLSAQSDDWRITVTGLPITTSLTRLTATGLTPKDSRESAVFGDFPAGSYTAILRGKNNTTGVALIEAYNIR